MRLRAPSQPGDEHQDFLSLHQIATSMLPMWLV
jgi:hypothetical protein